MKELSAHRVKTVTYTRANEEPLQSSEQKGDVFGLTF